MPQAGAIRCYGLVKGLDLARTGSGLLISLRDPQIALRAPHAAESALAIHSGHDGQREASVEAEAVAAQIAAGRHTCRN